MTSMRNFTCNSQKIATFWAVVFVWNQYWSQRYCLLLRNVSPYQQQYINLLCHTNVTIDTSLLSCFIKVILHHTKCCHCEQMAGNSLCAFILIEQLWASFDESIERIQKNPWKPTASMIVSLGAAVSGWQPFQFHTTTNDSWREPQKSIVCYQGEKSQRVKDSILQQYSNIK